MQLALIGQDLVQNLLLLQLASSLFRHMLISAMDKRVVWSRGGLIVELTVIFIEVVQVGRRELACRTDNGAGP